MKKYSKILILIFISFNFASAQNANNLIPKNKSFFIQSAKNWGHSPGGCWDIPGGENNIREKAPIKVWDLSDVAKDRKYVLENSSKAGFVKIHIEGVNGYVDVAGGSNKNGTHIQIYKPNNSSAQNFKFMYVGNGKFRIFNENGKVLCLNGRNNKNGTSIVIWDDHPGDWTEWYLLAVDNNQTLKLENSIVKHGENMDGCGTVFIQSATTYGKSDNGFLDVPGDNYPTNGNNLNVWAFDFGPDRIFNIINSDSDFKYYSISIAGNNNLLIDVFGNQSANGTNIGLWGKNGGSNQNYYFKYTGEGKYKIYNQNGKLLCLNNRISANGGNLVLWKDHQGAWTEWYLIDINTNKPFVPKNTKLYPNDLSKINFKGISGTEGKKLADGINTVYKRLTELDNKASSVYKTENQMNYSLTKAYGVVNKVDKLNSQVDKTYNVLSSFSRIPIIGAPASACNSGLRISKGSLDKVNTTLGHIKEPVIQQASNNSLTAMKSTVTLGSKIKYLKNKLYRAKEKCAAAEKTLLANHNTKLATKYENKSSAFNIKLVELNNTIDLISNNLNEIDKISKQANVISEPTTKVSNGINNFEKVFSKTDAATNEISKALNARFKKKIGPLKINICLKDVISGGKVGKVFSKLVNKWVDKLIQPALKKLNVKMPTLPGVDNFTKALNNSLDLSKKIKENSQKMKEAYSNFDGLSSELSTVIKTDF